MNKQYNINDRVFIYDNSGKHSATVTDIQLEHDGSGWLYKCEYDEGGYDWLIDCELELIHC